ncbi:MAG TPA: bifunctional UDP-N-acetylglucosamine diphosphorylase/glucosamine-1-phosphate N-acetyltransferase GlmU [Actinomycetota bacterium]|nr:bifunctional UDP-N-acetylglucosamine diphosphorylase/glucosamine-1-phosphate N-acetyltransferase GlmU [Actinomycetota bacterium]
MGSHTEDIAAVILAAGLGKRFSSAVPKVLHSAAGTPLIHHVLGAVEKVRNLKRLLVVVGASKDAVIESVRARCPSATFVEQAELLGTGDALRRCREALRDFEGTVLVLPGDGPLIRAGTLSMLASEHKKAQSACTLLTARLDDPTGYGRIKRNPVGAFLEIVEEADASIAERAIKEVSGGIWCFEKEPLFDALDRITNNNAQGEYYLPDAAAVIAFQGGRVHTVAAPDPGEIEGVNDRGQLAEATRRLRARKVAQVIAAGVTVEDPSTTYIDEAAVIGAETVLRPLTFIEGSTQVGKHCSIGPSTRVVDSVVEDGAEITFSVVKGAHIGTGASVGPYASIRPGTRLQADSKAGTFVEIKGSTIGEGSKVPHLSYVGDGEIGKGVNLGAGTITGNYDSETRVKSKTVVEDGAFTGSDTTLVAPVRVGRNAGTGAGSVVTRDVEEGEIVAGVPARPFRKRKTEGTETGH